ncbi:MAG: class I SAM-dependent methyltransferase [Desulfobacteraceae bacterium]|nr:MAG: class I SAM-dependent methyltransferase [Desulfobacteraceae bacterium]
MINSKKTTNAYWNSLYASQAEPSLPSKLSVGSRNLQRLFRQYVRPNMRVLEIGCAPGKQLAYVGKHLGASVAGLDYSINGIELSRSLFDQLAIKGDLRCEDIFLTTFQPESFDVVYSLGLIEHFDDPTDIVRRHVELLKPNGMALILVPNYGGIYGRLQRYFDPANLSIHNTAIMRPAYMQKLAPVSLSADVVAFSYGRMSPWLLNLDIKWPVILARMVSYTLNIIGLLQPIDIRLVCPLIVLRIKRV